MNNYPKKTIMIALLSFAAVLWGYHLTRISLEFPATHFDGLLVCSEDDNASFLRSFNKELADNGANYYALFRETLANSASIDARVLAVSADGDLVGSDRIDALSELVDLYPENSLGNLLYLNSCALASSSQFCDEERVERANSVNEDNGVSWALLAVHRYSLGDEFGVDQAMARAVAAPQFEDYFTTQLRVLRDAIPPGSDHLRMSLIWGVIGRLPSLTLNTAGTIYQLCINNDSQRVGLFQSCLDFGERMSIESRSTIMRLVGAGIQQGTYEAMGNLQEASRLEQEYLAYNRSRMSPDSTEGQFRKIGSLLSYDVNLANFWLENLAEFGEGGTTMSNTLAEARRLSADPDYAPCAAPGMKIRYR